MRLLLTLGLLCMAQLGRAQTPSATRLEKMQSVLFLRGHWVGKGWMLIGDKKEYFEQQETITAKLDNSLLLVEGVGKHAQSGTPIHQALALLTYDVGRQQYRWLSSSMSSGYLLDVVAQVSENRLVWGFSSPSVGQVRYTISLEKGVWLEQGESSRDGGQSWSQIFEMRLHKQPD